MPDSVAAGDSSTLESDEPRLPPIGSGRLDDVEARRWTAIGTAVAVGVFWLLGTAGHPLRLFDDPRALTSGFFDIQARSLMSGELSVPAGSLLVEEFVTPDGSHMYFGLLPSLLRIPALLIDTRLEGRLTLVSCLAAVVIMSLASARLGRRAQSLRSPLSISSTPSSPRWFALLAAAPALLSPALFLSSRSFVYNEAIAWGIALSLAGIDGVLQWWYRGDRASGWYLVALVTLAMHTRPTVGAIPLLTTLLFTAILILRRAWRKAAVGAGAVAAAVFTYSAVNYARFSRFIGVPHELQVSYLGNPTQQAAVALTDGSLFSPRFMLTSVWSYFNPFNGEIGRTRLFPFVRFDSAPRAFLDAPMQLTPTGSIPTSAPLLVVLGIVGAWTIVRRGSNCGAWRAVLAAGLVSAMATLGFWSVWHRYLSDFVPLLVTLSAVGLWRLRDLALSWRASRRRILTVALATVAIVGCLSQAGLTMWGRYFYLGPDHDELVGVIEFRYQLDRLLFDGPAPDVLRVPADETTTVLPAALRGEVLVAGDCDALYALSWGWRAVERRSGGNLRALVSPTREQLDRLESETSVIASGDGWSVRTQPGVRGSTLVLTYSNDVGVTVTGDVLLGFGPIVLDVIADPLTDQVQVLQNGRAVIELVTTTSGGLAVGPGWEESYVPAPLCESILDQR